MFSPQLADYDGDGRVDLVSGSMCCLKPDGFYVFLRQPDGRFGPRRRVGLRIPGDIAEDEYPTNGIKTKVAVVDWNGDGHPDALIGGNTRFVGVALGPLGVDRELPLARIWPAGRAPLTHGSVNPCVADWDSDGRLDLILGGCFGSPADPFASPGLYLFRNVGTTRDPALSDPELLLGGDDQHRFTGAAVADWDGDGRLDLIAARQDFSPGENRARTLRHHRIWVYRRLPAWSSEGWASGPDRPEATPGDQEP